MDDPYYSQRWNADARGIPFLLTREQWYAWWESTGHFHERGRKKGQYVMARLGDTGSYELGNIKCILATENTSEAFVHKPALRIESAERLALIRQSPEIQKKASAAVSKALTNNPKHPMKRLDVAAKVAAANKGRVNPAHSVYMTGANNPMFGNHPSEETRLRQASARRAYWARQRQLKQCQGAINV
jgi:hypothetical protein